MTPCVSITFAQPPEQVTIIHVAQPALEETNDQPNPDAAERKRLEEICIPSFWVEFKLKVAAKAEDGAERQALLAAVDEKLDALVSENEVLKQPQRIVLSVASSLGISRRRR